MFRINMLNKTDKIENPVELYKVSVIIKMRKYLMKIHPGGITQPMYNLKGKCLKSLNTVRKYCSESLKMTGLMKYKSSNYLDGRNMESFLQTGRHTVGTGNIGMGSWKWLSAKVRNNLMRQINGNGRTRQNITLAHWNLGAKSWQRKREEIEMVTMQYDLDILVITEANMDINLNDYEKQIRGYDIILPRTTEKRNLARIVMLVKQGVDVELMPDLMDSQVAAIWVKLRSKGRKPLVLSGIYREHRYLDGAESEGSESLNNQLERWRTYVNTWARAAAKHNVIILGDTNLDFKRWDSPENNKIKMVELVKEKVETMGFYQLIEGHTRCWNQQPDSLIDQCWSNVPEKLVYHKNEVRAYSDHNLIIVSFRTKERVENRHDIVKRVRKILMSQSTRDTLLKLTGRNFTAVRILT